MRNIIKVPIVLFTLFLFLCELKAECGEMIVKIVENEAQLVSAISETIDYHGEVTILIKNNFDISTAIFIDRKENYCNYSIIGELENGVNLNGLLYFGLYNGNFYIENINFNRTQHNVAKSILRLSNASNSIIDNCTFNDIINDNLNYVYIQIHKGFKNIIRNCFFEYKKSNGNVIIIRVDPSTTESTQDIRAQHTVENCNFKGLKQFSDGADAHMIAIGLCGNPLTESSHIFSNIKIENNLFENFNLEKTSHRDIINNKSSGNIYRANTFINCNGKIKLRCGGFCIVEENRFIHDKHFIGNNTSGVEIKGPSHTIVNNYFENLMGIPIRISCGMGALNYNLQEGEIQPCYQNSDNVTIAYNTIFGNIERNITPIQIDQFKTNHVACPNTCVNIFPKDLKIENNIVVGKTLPSYVEVSEDSETIENCLFAMPEDVIINSNIFYSEIPVTTVLKNLPLNNIIGENWYENPNMELVNGEYWPSINSSAINNADNNNYSGINHDINKINRIIDFEDIGCHERVGECIGPMIIEETLINICKSNRISSNEEVHTGVFYTPGNILINLNEICENYIIQWDDIENEGLEREINNPGIYCATIFDPCCNETQYLCWEIEIEWHQTGCGPISVSEEGLIKTTENIENSNYYIGVNNDGDFNLNINPNIFKNELNLSIFSENLTEVELSLVDLTGRRIYEQRLKLHKGVNMFRLDIDEKYSKGLMIVYLKSDNVFQSEKVIRR